MAVKLSLSFKEILDKKFDGASPGYNAYQVDSFLDRILEDYKTIYSSLLISKQDVEVYERQIADIKKENERLAIENASFAKKLDGIKDSDNVTTDNIELLRRIDKLEKFLWKQGFNPKDIK